MMNLHRISPRELRFNPPSFAAEGVAEIVARAYNLEGMWTPLDGERDQNFLLKSTQGEKYVVKIAGPDEDPDVVDFQVEALLHLERVAPQIPVPRIVRTQSGECLTKIISDRGVDHPIRVVTYLEGIPYGEGEFPDAQSLQLIGRFQGEVVNALSDFDHKASKHFMPWNLSNGIAVSKAMWAGTTDEARALGTPLLGRMRHEILPQLNAGPSQVIHNDAHPHNLLRHDATSKEVVGLIDFGDMVYAPVINDLAVMATTFHRTDREDLETVENLLIGFHKAHPLTDDQVCLLWDAMILRAIITVLLSDAKLNMTSDHDPDVVEDRVAGFAKLRIFSRLDRNSVVNRLRAACDFD